MKGLYVSMGVLLAALCVATAFSPSLGLVLVPASCLLTYALASATFAWLGVFPALAFAVAAAVVPGGKMLLTAAAALHAALAALPPFRRKIKSAWAEIGIAAAACTVACCAAVGFFALARGVGFAECIALECESLSGDGYALMLAEWNYKSLGADVLGHVPYSVHDELYVQDILHELGNFVFRELDGFELWYVSGFGAFAGGLASFGALACSGFFGISPQLKTSELRLGRAYLIAAVVPALVFAFFGFYEPMAPYSRTVVNLFVTLPTALCGITLLYHSLARVRGKPKIAAIVFFVIALLAAALFWEWGLMIFGFIGLADCLLDVRKLLDWALSDGT